MCLDRAKCFTVSLYISTLSFFDVINVDREAIFKSSSSFFESLVVQFFAAEASHSHVARFVCQILVAQLAWALLQNSVVERLWLIELFSVLRSILIGVSVSLGGPASAIP